MEFFEVVRKRRSLRSYQKVNIPKEDIIKILEAGILAPSGKNIQPFEFIVIDNEEIIEKLGEIASFIKDASVVIGIIAEPSQSKYWLEDISATTENMLLAIEDLGYASCWIEGYLLPKEEWAKKILGIPENKRFIIILPIGKPYQIPQQKEKKKISEITHYNKYGIKYL